MLGAYWTTLVEIFIFIFIFVHLAFGMPIYLCMASFIYILSINIIKVTILHLIEYDFIVFIFH